MCLCDLKISRLGEVLIYEIWEVLVWTSLWFPGYRRLVLEWGTWWWELKVYAIKETLLREVVYSPCVAKRFWFLEKYWWVQELCIPSAWIVLVWRIHRWPLDCLLRLWNELSKITKIVLTNIVIPEMLSVLAIVST